MHGCVREFEAPASRTNRAELYPGQSHALMKFSIGTFTLSVGSSNSNKGGGDPGRFAPSRDPACRRKAGRYHIDVFSRTPVSKKSCESEENYRKVMIIIFSSNAGPSSDASKVIYRRT
jgi:hypothetical protein